jgi:diguanylate cyclase (GGDEF)-like protein
MSIQRKRSDIYSSILVLLSLALLLWQHLGMNRTLLLSPTQYYQASVESDQQEGGDSVATLAISDFFKFTCDIKNQSKFSHPYCNLKISLSEKQAIAENIGVDLSQFDTFRITLDHRSDFQEEVRIYLNHYYEAKTASLFPFKLNLFSLKTKPGLHTYTIPLDQFYVPAWWVCNSQTDNPTTMLSNVSYVMISTGESVEGRLTELDVYSVEFSGKWLTKDALYQALLFFWLIYVGLVVLVRFIKLKRKNIFLSSLSKQLEQQNSDLDDKSQLYKQLATVDDLTGISNRLAMKQHLESLIKKYKIEKIIFSMLLIDIDHFKSINDTYGHDEGDRVLQELGSLLSTSVRKADIVGRWGGEEFMLICVDTDANTAVQIADHLRDKISTTDFKLEEPLTCSIGVAEVKSELIEDTFRAADKALYEAKNSGRNQVKKAEG